MHGGMSAYTSANNLAEDESKNIVLFINDFYPEYGSAFKKLSKKLGRPLRGIMLIDSTLKRQNLQLPDTEKLFEEIVCDFKNDGELRKAIKKLEKNLLLVSCSAESSQLDFRRVLPHVPYVLGPSEKSLEWATHKGKMREMIGAFDSSLVPRMQPVERAVENEIKKVTRAIDFPMMVKPTGLSDSSLVTKVHNEQELRYALHNTFINIHEVYKRTRGSGRPGVLVEEFIEGEQYTVDAYVNEYGKVWSLPLLRTRSAHSFGKDGFYTYLTETNTSLSKEELMSGYTAAEDAIHAIGLRSTIAHMDMMKTTDGWKIIEIGARPGAARQEVYEVSYGVDHALNELLIKIGMDPEVNHNRIVHSAVFKVYAEEDGVISSIEGTEEAKLMAGVYALQVYAKPGDVIRRTVNGGTVVAQGILFGEQPDALLDAVNYVRSIITLKIHHTIPEKVLVY
jgi:biotin carboxylase